jgi:HAE1 family hydrophobic/amphiphilic exporter-1
MVRKLAKDHIEPYLARIDGVAAAEVLGGTEREIQVRLRPEWLEAYRVAAPQVVAALRGANVLIPGGRISQGRQELNISTKAEFTSVEQVREVVVGQAGGVPIYLRDVADVVDGFESRRRSSADGRNSVILAVRKQSDATVQVAERVIEKLGSAEEVARESP